MNLVRALVEQGGADINKPDRFGRTPLDEADVNSMSEVAVYLWRKGAEPAKISGESSLAKTELVCTRPLVHKTPNGRFNTGFTSDGKSKVYVYGGFGLAPDYLNSDPLNSLPEGVRGQPLGDFAVLDLDDVVMEEIIPFSEKQPHKNLKLSSKDKGPYTKLLEDGLSAEAEYPSISLAQYQNDSIVRAEAPFKRSDGFGYFEVTIVDPGTSRITTVGLTNAGYDVTKQPGWMVDSYGLHGDDGNLFHNRGRGINFGERWSSGDVIGCGVNFVSDIVFYTKNGQFLGAPFRGVKADEYWATIGIANDGAKFKVNFGSSPFRFNFQVPAVTWKYPETSLDAASKPVAPPQPADGDDEEPQPAVDLNATGPGKMANPLLFHLPDKNQLLLIGADAWILDLGTMVWTKILGDITGGLSLISGGRLNGDPNQFVVFAIAKIPVPALRQYVSIPVVINVNVDTKVWKQIMPPSRESDGDEVSAELRERSRAVFDHMRNLHADKMIVMDNDELAFVGDQSKFFFLNPQTLEYRELEVTGHGLDVERPGVVKYSADQLVSFGGYYKSKDLPANEVTFINVQTGDPVKPHLTGVCVPRPRDGAQSALLTLTNPHLTGADVLPGDPKEKRPAVRAIIHAFGTVITNYSDEFDLIMLEKARKPDELFNLFSGSKSSTSAVDEMTGFVVKARDVSFHAHRAILWARSQYFRKLLTENPKLAEHVIDDISPLLLEEIWKLLYGDQIDLGAVERHGFREFIAVLERFAPNHCNRAIEERLLTKLSATSSMGGDVGALFLNELFSDVIFKTADGLHTAVGHKIVLCSRSPYFNAMFLGGMRESGQKEIILPEDTSFDAFLLALQFIYSKDVDAVMAKMTDDSGSLLIDLFDLACQYNLRGLKKELEHVISYNIAPDNVSTLLLMADQHHAFILRSHCAFFIANHQSEVHAEDDYLSQKDAIESVLASFAKQ